MTRICPFSDGRQRRRERPAQVASLGSSSSDPVTKHEPINIIIMISTRGAWPVLPRQSSCRTLRRCLGAPGTRFDKSVNLALLR